MHLVKGKTVDLNLSFIIVSNREQCRWLSWLTAVTHSPPRVCLTLLPRCYDVREEKQYLQDLLILLIGMCQLLFKYIHLLINFNS